MNFKINQVVKVKEEFETPRDKKGGKFNQYRIVKVMRVNVIAVNLGTFIPHTLRKDQLELIPDPLAYNLLKYAYTNNSITPDKEALKSLNI